MFNFYHALLLATLISPVNAIAQNPLPTASDATDTYPLCVGVSIHTNDGPLTITGCSDVTQKDQDNFKGDAWACSTAIAILLKGSIWNLLDVGNSCSKSFGADGKNFRMNFTFNSATIRLPIRPNEKLRARNYQQDKTSACIGIGLTASGETTTISACKDKDNDLYTPEDYAKARNAIVNLINDNDFLGLLKKQNLLLSMKRGAATLNIQGDGKTIIAKVDLSTQNVSAAPAVP